MATNITISTGGTTTVVTVPEVQNNVTVSRNEITSDERTKLAGIEAGATTDQTLTGGNNIIVSENGGDYTISLDDSVSLSGSLSVAGGINGSVTGSLNGNVTGDVDGNVSGNAGTVTNGIYTTSSIGDLSDVSTSGIGDDHVLVSDSNGNFTSKSTFEAFMSSAAQYDFASGGPLGLVEGDLDGDGFIGLSDLLAFLGAYGTSPSLNGYIFATFSTDGTSVDLQANNTLNNSSNHWAYQLDTNDLKTLDLTAPTNSGNYGVFNWVHNGQDNTIDLLGGQQSSYWHLDSNILIQQPSKLYVELGTNTTTNVAIYIHIVNEYENDPARSFTTRLKNFTIETDGEIDLYDGSVVTGVAPNNSYSIYNQTKFFVLSTPNNEHPKNIKISFHAGCPQHEPNSHVKVYFTNLKFKITQ